MDFRSYLGKRLKDEVIIELLEHYEVDVIYDFDRVQEASPDIYWAGSKGGGFELRFDEQQILDTIFLRVVESDGYRAVTEEIGVPVFNTFDEAKSDFLAKGLAFAECPAPPGDSWHKKWIKCISEGTSVHYEFEDGSIQMVTISAEAA